MSTERARLTVILPILVLASAASIMSTDMFMSYAMMPACGLGAIFAFITAAPFLLIDNYGVPTQHFGYYQGVIVAAFFAGSLLASHLAGRVHTARLLILGLLAAGAGGVAIPVLELFGVMGRLELTAAMTLLAFGLGPVFAIAPARALEATDRPTGTASAMFGALEMGISGLASASVTVFHDGTAMPFAATVVGLLAIAGFSLTRTRAASR